MTVKVRIKYRAGFFKRSEIEIECNLPKDLAVIKEHITWYAKI